MFKLISLKIFILLVAVFTTACDPAMHIVPQGWSKIGTKRYSKAFGPLDVEMDRAGGLIGERWFDPNISLRNKGNEVVKIGNIFLTVNEERYESITKNKAELTLRPNEARDLPTRWEFPKNKALFEVFKTDTAEIHIEGIIGNEELNIVIKLNKEKT